MRRIIKKDDLNNLDVFIQKCLDNFKFVEPKKELYEAAGNDKDIIISHKSTIPDLVIWNKPFNKNKCFIGANTMYRSEFPRFLFYIKIKKNKKAKINTDIKNNEIFSNNSDFSENNNKSLYPNINNGENINSKDKQEKINKNVYIIQNNNINNNSSGNNMNLLFFLIQLYLEQNGWIILTKDEHFSGPGTSLDLFQYLQEKIEEKSNLNEYIIIDINKQVKYFGDYFYMILSNFLPTIVQKKYMKHDILNNHNLPHNNVKYYEKNNNNISLLNKENNNLNIINNNIITNEFGIKIINNKNNQNFI